MGDAAGVVVVDGDPGPIEGEDVGQEVPVGASCVAVANPE